jgi:predicted ribosome-associated RNA-binding protein Tma20
MAGKVDGPLRILHQYPDMMPKLRTDKGAIKFVLSGANIMCPGFTSPGATIHDEVRDYTVVILLECATLLPKLRTDKGAIKFVLSGANIMCPGLTSPGATIHDEVRVVTLVALVTCNTWLSCNLTGVQAG